MLAIMLTCNARLGNKKRQTKRGRAVELAIANCGSARTASTDQRGEPRAAERYVTGRGCKRGGLRAEKRQRQNATNSKRAESCACIRNAIEPLSTGTGPLLSTREGERRERGEVTARSAPSTPRAAGKF